MDEPGLKAKFKLTLIRHQSFPSTFFNTPIVGTTTNGEWVTESFNTTVDMSTYLVAFVISDFKVKATNSVKGVKIEVAAKPQSIDAGEGDFALSEASKIIDFFADYFNVPYPLAKSSNSTRIFMIIFYTSLSLYFILLYQYQAQIAIPDFNAGGKSTCFLLHFFV